LLASAWFGLDDVYWASASDSALILLGLATTAALAVPLWRVLRSLQDDERSRATWMLVGSALALVPVLAAEPSIRVLGVSMVGVSGLVGLILDRAWLRREPEPFPTTFALATIVTLALGIAHFVRGPIDTVLATQRFTEAATAFNERVAWLRDHLNREKSTAIVLRAETPSAIFWTPFMLRNAAPARWRVLSFRAGTTLAIRTGPRSLELIAQERPLFPIGPYDLFRDVGELRAGDVLDVAGMHATILALDSDQMPSRLRFDFDRDLDDPSVQCVSERLTGFEEVMMPPVGIGVRLVP
jgi:hypothetical protein